MAEFDFLALSEYALTAGIFLMAVNLFLCAFKCFLWKEAIFGEKRLLFASNLALLCFEVLFLAFSLAILLFGSEKLLIFVATPLLCISLAVFFMLLWAFVQLRGISSCSMAVLETLVGVIEAGDQNLDGHSLHVQNLAMLIYDYLPFSYRIKINPTNLQYASLLLDVGKLGIPREIIDKTGKLLPHERELIQTHPEICFILFESLPPFKLIRQWIKYHHERVDGSGYYHLKNTEIPLASRLLAVADTYSALTMNRSYKASLPYENAVSELRLVAGTQLDSELVEIFCTIPKQKIALCMKDVREQMKKYQVGKFR